MGAAKARAPDYIAADLAALAVPLHSLRHYERNPRQGDIGAITDSLRHHGQFRPLVVNKRDNTVLAGNHTLAAARALGWDQIAVTYVDVDDEQAARIVLADNRINDLAYQDSQKLSDLLQSLPDLSGTGYDGDALDALLADLGAIGAPDVPEHEQGQGQDGDPALGEGGDLDVIPDLPADPRTQPGDLLVLGPHRLLCADCRDERAVERLLDGRPMNLVFTSPPYAAQRTYDQTSGFEPVPERNYVSWYADVASVLARHLAADGSYFLNIKEHTVDGQRSLYVKDLCLAHVRAWGWLFVDELCWIKTAMPGLYTGRFKNGWEPVYHFVRGRPYQFFPEDVSVPSDEVPVFTPQTNFQMGPDGTEQETKHRKEPGMALPSNVLSLRGHAPDAQDAQHPAAFPVALPSWFIRAFSKTGDLVCDPFCGSGSTLIAAHQHGRVFAGTEISPAYCDVVARRYTNLTGEQVTWHRSSGEERR